MKNRKNPSVREHALMIVTFLFLVGVAYYFLRFRQLQDNDELKSRQVAEVRGKIGNLVFPVQVAGSEADAQASVGETQEKLLRERDALASLRSSFVDSGDAEGLQDLKLKMSKLAEACGVRITKSTPIIRPKPTIANEVSRGASGRAAPKSGRQTVAEGESQSLDSLLVSDGESGRPVERLETLSTYHGLHRFFSSLARLPHRVVVMEFQVSVVSGDPPLDRPVQMLKSELVVIR